MLAKKIFIGSSIFFITLLILWGVYTLLFSAPESEQENTAPNPEQVGDSEQMDDTTDKKTVQSVITTPILAPNISGDGKTLYYIDKLTGYIYSLDTETNEKKLLVEKDMPGIITATWPSRGTQVIIKSQEAVDSLFRLYDIRSNEPIRLKDGIRYVVWDALSDRIIYSYEGSGSSGISLALADSNGSNWKDITTLPSAPARLTSVPQSPLVSYWDTPINTRINPLTTVSLTNGEKKTLFEGKYGADYLWSPRGDTVLISWTPEKNGPKLALATFSANGGNYMDLNFPTLVSKCVWSRDDVTLYCANPGMFPSGTVLPEDYSRKYTYTKDSFWKINTKTGEMERIIELQDIDKEYDATNLLINGNESKLFFINRKDDMLYSIEL